MSAQSAPRIEIVDLVKTYRREGGATITPVNRINLVVDANELVVLLGPSGCGKTTLLRCVAGLERPNEGEIVINGRVVFSSKKGIYEPADRRAVSMVFQSYALWPHMSVAQNVAYPLQSAKLPRQTIDQRVSAVLDMVGVGGLAGQYPGRISGGQQQRVALARALVGDSSVVLFDEPLSNVDAQVRAQLRVELQGMQRRLGFSGLYVTHDQAEAMELGHRVAVLDSGVIAGLGTPEEIYSSPPNEYVAGFVGVANIWRGEVRSVDADLVEVLTPVGVLRADRRSSRLASIAVGDRLSVIARPEHFQLGPPAEPTSQLNAISGTVDARLFSGPHTEFVIASGEARLVVWTNGPASHGRMQPGDGVIACIAPDQLRLVPTDKADV